MRATLKVFKRTALKKYSGADLRAEGLLPAIVYGHKPLLPPLSAEVLKLKPKEKELYEHTRGTPVSTSQKDIEKLMFARGASIENTLVDLFIDDTENPITVLPRHLQIHPIQRNPTNISFLAYDPKKGAKVYIPLYFDGAEELNGYVHKTVHYLHCKVIGDTIPASIAVDCNEKPVGYKIFSYDLVLPNNVTILRNKSQPSPENILICSIGGKREFEGEIPQKE